MKKLLLILIYSHYLYSACSDTNTIAKEPLKMINAVCLESNIKKENFKNIYVNNKYIFISKGSLGFDILKIRHVDYPVANSIQIVLQDSEKTHTDFVISDEKDIVYTASKNNLLIYKLKNTKYKAATYLYRTINMGMSASYMYNDDKYIYIGGSNTLKVYSKKTQNIIYDYNDIDGNVTSIVSKEKRIYISTDKEKIEVLAKNHIGYKLILAKVKYDGYKLEKSAKNLFLNNKSIISYASDDGLDYNTISASTLKPQKKYKIITDRGLVNKFAQIDNFNIISTDKGLFVDSILNTANKYKDYFNSVGFDIYDEFIILADINENTINNQLELKIRAYKLNSVGASSVFGYVPMTTSFHVDTINIKKVQWSFGDVLSRPIQTKNPSYIYKRAGAYQAIATVTYYSGRVYTNYVNIITEEKNSFDFSILKDKYIGSIPFLVKFSTHISKEIQISSVLWDFGDDIKSSILNPSHTFTKAGKYNVSAIIEDYNGLKVEKKIIVEAVAPLSGEIKYDYTGSSPFANTNVNFSLSLTSILKIDKYKWMINNDILTTENLTYHFPKAGKYTIKLTIIDTKAIEYLFTTDIEIFDYKRPSVLVSRTYGETPLKVDFEIKVPKDASYQLNNIKWILPNHKPSNELKSSYIFKNEGLFKINYEYRLSNGYSIKDYIDVNVSNNLSLRANINKNFAISPFNVLFEYNAFSFNGIKEYEIDFGDNTPIETTINPSISHTFTKAGEYIAKVTAISNKGNRSTKAMQITVISIDASFNTKDVDFDRFYAYSELKLNFEVNVSDDRHIDKYSWDFGDDQHSLENIVNVSHTYLENKTFIAKLNIVLDDKSHYEKILFITPPTPPGNFQVYKGWNLIGNTSKTPIKKSLNAKNNLLPNQNFLDIKLYSSAKAIWIFENKVWYKNPSYIDPSSGIWIDMHKKDKLAFYGNKNIPNFSNIKKGWSLLSTGIDIDDLSIYNFTKVIKFVNQTKEWVNDPKKLKAGDGFLVFVE